ncbi:hypothetical protein C8E95_3585 [Pseudonocardia autotrophica]|uniref:Uncharacterized protein n=2 Tax=Pseudonocardia TaxID=1847 RepID=A0A1Y2MXD2_PSEAH|nr:hypothetical protein BG845_03101 [Pseudonocardia autotrophica]TDN74462.1 hypothetical protein C8E95_3585 [Pseudonocardia autotrophica]BBG05229.1 hypothetical protein Pdca_64380 [Pseudonocardia autotrophica]GEC25763.1 hypothetical protein PSA01_27920 [Pseudonocardia saturnea]
MSRYSNQNPVTCVHPCVHHSSSDTHEEAMMNTAESTATRADVEEHEDEAHIVRGLD